MDGEERPHLFRRQGGGVRERARALTLTLTLTLTQVVYVSGRVHSGETPASHVVGGLSG